MQLLYIILSTDNALQVLDGKKRLLEQAIHRLPRRLNHKADLRGSLISSVALSALSARRRKHIASAEICRPADIAFAFRHHEHAVRLTVFSDQKAFPHLTLGTQRSIVFQKLSIRKHVHGEVFIVDFCQQDGFDDLIRPFLFYPVRPHQVVCSSGPSDKPSASIYFHNKFSFSIRASFLKIALPLRRATIGAHIVYLK